MLAAKHTSLSLPVKWACQMQSWYQSLKDSNVCQQKWFFIIVKVSPSPRLQPHKCGLHIVASFQTLQYGRWEGRATFQWRSENGTLSLWSSPQEHKALDYPWEKHETDPNWGMLCKIPDRFSSKLLRSKSKASLRNYHSQEEPESDD